MTSTPPPRRALALFILGFLSCVGTAETQVVLPNFPDTNGPVYTTAVSGTKLYVGGDFTKINPFTTGGIPIEPATGQGHAGFPPVLGTVNSVVSDGLGGWYVGGEFTSIGGVSRLNLAHIVSDQTVSGWNPSPDGPVTALATDGSTLYVGGAFSHIGGAQRSAIAAVSLATGDVTTWNPSLPGPVSAIAVHGSSVHVVGSASNALYSGHVATLDAATGLTLGRDYTNGPLESVLWSGGTLYVGGSFTGFLTPRNVARIDGATAALTLDFPKVQGDVYAVAPDGNGGWFLGGLFSSVGGTPAANLAHVLADNTVADWDPNPDGVVKALAVSGSTVYVGGAFTSVGGAPRNRIAAVDASTGLSSGWDPNADGEVTSLAIAGNVVYAGGGFTTIAAQTHSHLAGLDATTGQPTAAPGTNDDVACLVVSDGILYAGGSFTSVGAETRVNIAALDAATGQVTSWSPAPLATDPICHEECIPCGPDACCGSYWVCDPGPFTSVWALAVVGSNVFIAGTFDQVGGLARSGLAALDVGTGAVSSFLPGVGGAPHEMAAGPGKLYLALPSFVDGQPSDVLLALDANSGAVIAWQPDIRGSVLALAVDGSTVCAGGTIYALDTPRNNVAAIDPVPTSVTDWNPSANGRVCSLSTDGSVVYAGGEFTAIGGESRNRIAALNPATGLATPWNPDAGGAAPPDGTLGVRTLAVNGGTVYAGGEFSVIGGQARKNLAAIDAATGQATAWDPQAVRAVKALAVGGSFVYAGGDLGQFCGLARMNLAVIDVQTGQLLPWVPNPNGVVRAMTVDGSTLYAGGEFTTIAGQARNFIASFDTGTEAITTWDPSADGAVQALLAGPGVVYAGGRFTGIGGQARHWLAALDPATGQATSWDPNPQNPDPSYPEVQGVRALALTEPILWAGGSFTSIGSVPTTNLAGIDASTGAAQHVFYPPWDNRYCCSPVTALSSTGALLYIGTAQRLHSGSIYGVISGWQPQVSGSGLSLVEANGTVYVGGQFSQVGNSVRNGIAAVNFNTEALIPWYPAMETGSQVASITQSGNRFYLGGSFTSLQGTRHNLAAVTTAVTDVPTLEEVATPAMVSLGPSLPNPSVGRSEIQFRTAKSGPVTLRIFDVAGREVRTLVEQSFASGPHRVTWDGMDRAGRDVATGIYFAVLRTEGAIKRMKIAVLR
jgi:hypothetical protein